MKVTREQAEQNRQRIVEVAAQLFRERGFDGVSVADLMGGAGLTHGGFYGHFPSKQDLEAEACAKAMQELDRTWSELRDRTPRRALSAIASRYVSAGHRDNPGVGCVVPSLGADAARQGPGVRLAVTEGVKRFVSLLAGIVPGRTAELRRRQALTSFAAMVGAVVVARAVSDAALSDEILQAVRSQIAELDKPRSA